MHVLLLLTVFSERLASAIIQSFVWNHSKRVDVSFKCRWGHLLYVSNVRSRLYTTQKARSARLLNTGIFSRFFIFVSTFLKKIITLLLIRIHNVVLGVKQHSELFITAEEIRMKRIEIKELIMQIDKQCWRPILYARWCTM